MQATASTTGPLTRILTGAHVRAALDLDTCIEAVERAFRIHGEKLVGSPAVAGIHAAEGGFHIKAGLLPVEGKQYFVAKTNANFPGNPNQRGLPTIQGIIVVCDAECGSPLAVMDSIEITTLRTAAATAVAARYLARPDAHVAAIVGCGLQGEANLRALSRVRTLTRALLYDSEPGKAEALAARMAPALNLEIEVAPTAGEAALHADMVVTCTPSSEFLFTADSIQAGTFVAGVGVDDTSKRELPPALLAGATLVVDVLGQAAAFGDLYHAIAAGAATVTDVHAELGAVVCGASPGRRTESEITVFDSTGMALQDAAAAAIVYEVANRDGMGSLVAFSS